MSHGSPFSYEQAEYAFSELERERQEGRLTDAQYRARHNALRVVDEEGRTWMIQEGSGTWYVYHNDTWIAGTPPGRAPAAPEPPPTAAAPTRARTRHARVVAPATSQPRPATAAAPPNLRRVGCAGLTLRIILWDLLWMATGYGLYTWIGRTSPWSLAVLAAAALASLIWWVRRASPRAPQGA